MNNSSNANRHIDRFENSIHPEVKSKQNSNRTLDDYTENMAVNGVGNLADYSNYDDDYRELRNNDDDYSYNDDTHSHRTYDESEYEQHSYDELEEPHYDTHELDSLNGFDDYEEYSRPKKTYSHQVPYSRSNNEQYSHEDDYDYRQPKPYENQRYDEYDEDSHYNNKRAEYSHSKDHYEGGYTRGISQDTSNLSEIDDVSNFYNDKSNTVKMRQEYNRNMAKLDNEEYFDTLSTMASIDAIRDTPKHNRGARRNNITYRPDDTLKNQIDYEEYSNKGPHVERPREDQRSRERRHREDQRSRERRPREEQRPRQKQQHRRDEEVQRREHIEQKKYEERKRRLSEKRKQDTSMQPAIRGYTGTIPTINSQHYSDNRNSKSYEKNTHNNERDYSQREQSSKTRRTPITEKHPKKRSQDEIYRRRYERQVGRTILFTSVGIITTILAMIGVFYMTYKYNSLKDEYTIVNNEYENLKLNQDDVIELQLKIDELERINNSLINPSDKEDDSVDGSEDGNPNEDIISDDTSNQGQRVTHVVQSGEYLSTISTKYYGDGSYVQKIKDANNLSDDNIFVGQELLIP